MSKTYALSDLIRAENFIDGQWVPAESGKRFAVTDPATGERIVEVADSGPADARAATDAAARAFPAWRDALPKERAAVLHRWHDLMIEHADELGRLISLEQGKPLAEGRGEVLYGASYVAWFAAEATRVYGDIIPNQQRGKRMSAVKEPVGIVAGTSHWR
jgi:succinate-semialdehyde dehydrogenase/glutarate-semialdehyde dehydrogenase